MHIHQKKIAGILLESEAHQHSLDYVILGIVLIWGIFLIVYTVFFEYRWLHFPNWK